MENRKEVDAHDDDGDGDDGDDDAGDNSHDETYHGIDDNKNSEIWRKYRYATEIKNNIRMIITSNVGK